MADNSSSDLTEATSKQGRSFHSRLSGELKEPPVLDIKSMTLEPALMRHQSGKSRKLSKDSEPDKHLSNESKEFINYATLPSSLPTTDSGKSEGKSPHKINDYLSRRKLSAAQAGRLVKRPSLATFSDDFPPLETMRHKLTPPVCSRSFIKSEHAEYVPVLMQLPPAEYLHQCMPVSYYLKTSPSAVEDYLNKFQYLHYALSLHPVLQPSRFQRHKETKNCCELSTKVRPPSSSSKSYPTTKTVKKSPRKPIPIPALSIKGIPKELDVVSIYDRYPIVYNQKYNLKYLRVMKKYIPDKIMLPDKPARVYSILEAKLYKVMIDECIEWEALDITCVFDITKYIPDAVKKFDIVNVARIMKVNFYEAIPNWDDFDSALLLPLRIQMMGSVVACKLAMDLGWAINIGGGFCHNTSKFGKGLAVYDDVLVCLAIVSKFPNVNHILLIDCDAYQSSNYKYVEDISCQVTILDFYFKPFYESAINQPTHSPNDHVEYYGYKFDSGKANHYLFKLWKLLCDYLKDPSKPQPSLCIYVAGTNIMDPNNPVSFTTKNIVTRDQIIFRTLYISNDIPVTILLGGGYQTYDVEAAAASIHQLCKTVRAKKKPESGSNLHSNS